MSDVEDLAGEIWNRYHEAGSNLDMLLHVASRDHQDASHYATEAREELEAVIESLKEIEAAEADP